MVTFQFNRGDTVKVRTTSWSGIKGKLGVVKAVHKDHCVVTFENLIGLEGKTYSDDLSFANSELEYVHSQEDIEDFRNLIPIHIRMSAEEFAWLKAKIDADEEVDLPNLKALSAHPPHGVF